jgi:hypothetical protein
MNASRGSLRVADHTGTRWQSRVRPDKRPHAGSVWVAGDDDALFVGEHDGLHPVAQAELEQDAADMAPT